MKKYEDITLQDARLDLEDAKWKGEVSLCPCCDQTVKIYKRKIGFTMVRQMRKLNSEREPMLSRHLTMGLAGAGDVSKLVYWGLLEQHEDQRLALTTNGVAFLHGFLSVPKWAFVYNGDLLQLGGPSVYVNQCLGNHSMEDLMGPFDDEEMEALHA